MHFRSIRAHQFRLLRDTKLELHPDLNYFVGGNGAGKTTVLEAVHVLSRASSHRGAAATLVSDGANAWALEGSLTGQDVTAPPASVQVRWVDRRISVELNHESVSLADLVRQIPTLILDPLAHRIMDEGPGIRRRYIDWGVFHMEHRFHPAWVRMNRALKQRNAGLRSNASLRELAAWNQELVHSAELVSELRREYVRQLQQLVTGYWTRLVGASHWQLKFQPGWKEAHPYAETLARNLDGDRKLGYTREGPHRAELQILSDNTELKDRISRGQQKLLVAALVLAQSELYRLQHDAAPILLIDDFAAELSQESQNRLLTELERYAGQKVIAALDYSEAMRASASHHMFHMEHGQITATNKTT